MKDRSSEQFDKMTKTPIPRLILGLGIPTTISMLVTNLYNMADTYFVGKLGTSASGATGIVFGLMALIQACGFMYGQGAATIAEESLEVRTWTVQANMPLWDLYQHLLQVCSL